MSNNGAPDSWESQAEVKGAKDSNDMSSKFSTLNVDAMEFVPSFSKSSPTDDSSESPTTTTPQKSESGSTNSAESPVLNGKSSACHFIGNKVLKFCRILS